MGKFQYFRMCVIYIIYCVLFTYLILISNGKIFKKCEFVSELYKLNISWNDIPSWVCLANATSHFNTSYLNKKTKNTNYGIFQINNAYWCDKDPPGASCKIDCNKLLDDELKDDMECAYRVLGDGDGFNQWSQYKEPCGNKDLSNYIIDCEILNSTRPRIVTEKKVTFYIGNKTQVLNCKAEGFPPPNIQWIYDKSKFPTLKSLKNDDGSNGLVFSNVNLSHSGFYTCLAKNFKGSDEKNIEVDVKNAEEEINEESRFKIEYAMGIFILLITLLFVVAFIVWYKIKKSKFLSAAEIKEFRNGNQELWKNESMEENYLYAPYNSNDFELSLDNLIIDKSTIIGSGEFGMIFIGKFNNKKVAVKTVNPNKNKLYLKSLLSEVKIMSYLNNKNESHSNIIYFIGSVTQYLNEGKLYLVMEYCSMGSLESYLRKNRNSFLDNNPQPKNSYQNFEALISPSMSSDCRHSVDILYRWTEHILRGMNFLRSKHVIHGDLATRNVLLTEDLVCKITDFGLSRQTYNYMNYVKKSQEPLPWRWLAIESLRDRVFSIQSDIWAFGITIWEVFSLGGVPYPELNWTMGFVKMLEGGFRPSKPNLMSNEIFESVLEPCWLENPEMRPNFEKLISIINRIRDNYIL